MEVILLVDVKNVGKKNQTVSVSDGFAVNFLIKRKIYFIKRKVITIFSQIKHLE